MTRNLEVKCHCGAVALEVRFPDGPLDGARCNCSLCRRKGAIMVGVPIGDLTVVRGTDVLRCYEWNTRIAKHYFCGVCGIYTHHQRRRDPTQFGVNVGCVDGLEIDPLGPARVVDGASLSREPR